MFKGKACAYVNFTDIFNCIPVINQGRKGLEASIEILSSTHRFRMNFILDLLIKLLKNDDNASDVS